MSTNIDFCCDTDDCFYWKSGVCTYPGTVTIQEHCCINYEKNVLIFTSTDRMAEIANNAIDLLKDALDDRTLYSFLSGSLKMTDDEILAAGFAQLENFMERKS